MKKLLENLKEESPQSENFYRLHEDKFVKYFEGDNHAFTSLTANTPDLTKEDILREKTHMKIFM